MGNKEIIWGRVFESASVKRVFNCLQAIAAFGLSTLIRKSVVWGVPFVLTVEPTVRCNLHCPQCVTGMSKVARYQSSLTLNQFKNIIEQIGDRVWYLLLFNQGEPFLNPDLVDFIKIAKQKRIYVTTSTNGHFFSDLVLVHKLVNSGLDSIIISLDGVDEQTYSKYRTGGNFQQVIDGIHNLIAMRNKCKHKTPKVFIQFLVMKHNEHQRYAMIKLAKKLKADRLLFKTFQVESREDGMKFLPENPNYRRYRFENESIRLNHRVKNRCFRLWYSTVILSDGRIVPCCFDKNGKITLGKVNKETTIEQIWKSDVYNKFRTRILEKQQSIGICQNCTESQKVYL